MQSILRRPKSLLSKGRNIIAYSCDCQIRGNPVTRSNVGIVYVICPTRTLFRGICKSDLRYLSLSSYDRDKEPLKPSSKVEVTVQAIKEEKKEPTAVIPVVKKSIKQRIVDEILHYYHGFRLLFIDIKISTKLCWRVLRGTPLSRREHRLLVRTVGDLFRLVPFSVFIIVPFMELLLPVAIKLFPGMLPSTFQTATEREDKMKQSLKIKLEMAKFLQKTLDDMAVQHVEHKSASAKEFAEWFKKIRTSGTAVTNEEMMRFSKLFADEITLDSLSRGQLIALCRVLEMQALGTNAFLRFQLRMKLRSLAADDKVIRKEGVNSLTVTELQQACKARGMRAYGMPETELKRQLSAWLDLSQDERVPPSLLLLSRAMMLPESIPTSAQLQATIQALPEQVATQAKAAIGEREGKIDNKVKLELIRAEEKRIVEERREAEQRKEVERQQEAERLKDTAPVVSAAATPELNDPALAISKQDFDALEHALDTVAKDKHSVMVEKETIEDLKEELADYQEDLKELHQVTATDESTQKVRESKAARRLYNKVNSMITKMDSVLEQLEKKEIKLKTDVNEAISIEDLMKAIRRIIEVPDETRLSHIERVLGKMDDDRDGAVRVEDVLKVIEVIGKEDVKLSAKQVDELIELIDKEELLEVEDRIGKTLQKEIDAKEIDKELPSCDRDSLSMTEDMPVKFESEQTFPPIASKNKSAPKSAL